MTTEEKREHRRLYYIDYRSQNRDRVRAISLKSYNLQKERGTAIRPYKRAAGAMPRIEWLAKVKASRAGKPQRRMARIYRPEKIGRDRGLTPAAAKVVAERRRHYVSWWKSALNERAANLRHQKSITEKRRRYANWWKFALLRQDEGEENKLSRTLRSRVRRRLSKFRKMTTMLHGLNLFGCEPWKLRAHIEAQWKPGWNWKNYGTVWNIDHIVPLVAFNLEIPMHQRISSHFTNLQPMEWLENSIKNRTMPENHQPELPLIHFY